MEENENKNKTGENSLQEKIDILEVAGIPVSRRLIREFTQTDDLKHYLNTFFDILIQKNIHKKNVQIKPHHDQTSKEWFETLFRNKEIQYEFIKNVVPEDEAPKYLHHSKVMNEHHWHNFKNIFKKKNILLDNILNLHVSEKDINNSNNTQEASHEESAIEIKINTIHEDINKLNDNEKHELKSLLGNEIFNKKLKAATTSKNIKELNNIHKEVLKSIEKITKTSSSNNTASPSSYASSNPVKQNASKKINNVNNSKQSVSVEGSLEFDIQNTPQEVLLKKTITIQGESKPVFILTPENTIDVNPEVSGSGVYEINQHNNGKIHIHPVGNFDIDQKNENYNKNKTTTSGINTSTKGIPEEKNAPSDKINISDQKFEEKSEENRTNTNETTSHIHAAKSIELEKNNEHDVNNFDELEIDVDASLNPSDSNSSNELNTLNTAINSSDQTQGNEDEISDEQATETHFSKPIQDSIETNSNPLEQNIENETSSDQKDQDNNISLKENIKSPEEQINTSSENIENEAPQSEDNIPENLQPRIIHGTYSMPSDHPNSPSPKVYVDNDIDQKESQETNTNAQEYMDDIITPAPSIIMYDIEDNDDDDENNNDTNNNSQQQKEDQHNQQVQDRINDKPNKLNNPTGKSYTDPKAQNTAANNQAAKGGEGMGGAAEGASAAAESAEVAEVAFLTAEIWVPALIIIGIIVGIIAIAAYFSGGASNTTSYQECITGQYVGTGQCTEVIEDYEAIFCPDGILTCDIDSIEGLNTEQKATLTDLKSYKQCVNNVSFSEQQCKDLYPQIFSTSSNDIPAGGGGGGW